MLGYKRAKEKGKRVYSDPYDNGPQNVEEWWTEIIVSGVLIVGMIAFFYFLFKTQ